jgi:RNA polymerase sigma-70 factor (ECF subfamily)
VLARFHDLSYREIGEILDCTEGAVKARIYRALQTLSLQLGDKESAT